MPIRIAVIAEGPVDFRHITALIDRKVRDHAPDWWDEYQLEHEREYCGIQPHTPFTQWRELRAIPATKGLLRHGGILDLRPPQRYRFDYPLARKALVLCARMNPRPDAALLVRDMDNRPHERAESINGAREEVAESTMHVVLALPRAKREAWALAGWEPQDDGERRAFAVLREELAFHPCENAEQLNACEPGATRDAKRVLAFLTCEDFEREAQCWETTAWATLRMRGQRNGLADFFMEVKDRLVLLITRSTPQ